MAGAGGYDYEFVNTPPERLVCKICHIPCRDAHLTGCCGAHFCRSCLQQVRRGRSVSRACPMCRAERYETFQNKEANREIRALHVYCLNERNGCTWSGEVNDVKKHVDADCQFVDMPCPSKCGMKLKRQCIQSHLAKDCPCHCQYCGFTGRKMEVASRHKKNCSQYPLPCPNNCEMGVVPTAEMADHKKVCPLEVVACEYYEMGCDVWLPRRDLEKHNTTDMGQHLTLMKQAFAAMTKDLKNMKSTQDIQYEEITDLLTISDNKICSVAEETDTVKDTQMKQNESIEQLKKDTNISTKLIAVFIVALIVYAVCLTVMLFESNDQSWRVSLQQNSCLDMCTDGVAPIIIKMSNFTEMKRSREQWYSSPFLAFNNGYQMRLRVNFLDDTSPVMVTLQLLKGPYDDELEKRGNFPLQMLASVELLNQAQDSYHYLIPVMLHTHSCGGCARRVKGAVDAHLDPHGFNSLLIPQSVITKKDNFYFHNDHLNFRVSVLLRQDDYFPLTFCYYYLYIVGSADHKWMFLITVCASIILCIVFCGVACLFL